MSDCKNEQVKMITNGTDEVAEVFLHGYLCNTIPRWKILPRPVKHKLMKKLGERNYNNIHDPRLYEDLDRIWKARKDMKDKDIIDRANLAVKVECAVCMETYDDRNDNVTRLMCGHKFCTRCVMHHISHSGHNACCPLCRHSVFADSVQTRDDEPVEVEVHVHEAGVPMNLVGIRTREKRRLERMRKRQRKKENKN